MPLPENNNAIRTTTRRVALWVVFLVIVLSASLAMVVLYINYTGKARRHAQEQADLFVPDEALSWLKLAYAYALADPSAPDHPALADIASVMAQAGSVETSLEIARSLPMPSSARALRNIVQTLCAEGELRRADGVISKMPDGDFKAEACIYLAEAYAAADNPKAAEDMFHAAAAVADKINTAGDTTSAYWQQQVRSKIASSQARIFAETDPQKALDFADSLRDAEQKANALCAVAEVLARRGDIEAARRVADSIVEDYAGYQKPKAFIAIAGAYALAGDIPSALRTADGIGDNPQQVNSKTQALCAIALAQSRAGDTDGAFRTFELAVAAALGQAQKDTDDFALFGIAARQIEAGLLDNARRTAEYINPDSFWRARADSLIISADVVQNLQEALLDQTAVDYYIDAAPARLIAQKYAQQNRLEELLGWLDSLEYLRTRIYVCIGAAEGLMLSDQSLQDSR